MDDDTCNNFLQVDEEDNFDVCYHCQYHRLDHKMITMERRNKNAGKELIDWDLNIYMPEQWDEEADDSFYDPASWRIHVYACKDGSSDEWDDPIALTAEEIQSLGLNRDSYFKDEVDVWYGLEGFRFDYWDKFSDRLKEYFDRLPKYWEDLAR